MFISSASAVPQNSHDAYERRCDGLYMHIRGQRWGSTSIPTRLDAAKMSDGRQEHVLTVQARAIYANYTLSMVEIGTLISTQL
jgi:hypothetical protein